jgi:hypothetical protein
MGNIASKGQDTSQPCHCVGKIEAPVDHWSTPWSVCTMLANCARQFLDATSCSRASTVSMCALSFSPPLIEPVAVPICCLYIHRRPFRRRHTVPQTSRPVIVRLGMTTVQGCQRASAATILEISFILSSLTMSSSSRGRRGPMTCGTGAQRH